MKAVRHTRTRRLLRRTLTPLTAVALTLGVSAGLATSASASGTYTGAAYVMGNGSMNSYGLSTDRYDEGVVSKLTDTKSDATCLWQKVLWADGYLDRSGIDGAFGANTAYATSYWQEQWGLAPDGSAGRNTWSMAGQWLRDGNGDGKVDYYEGFDHNFSFTIDSSGRHHFPDDTGTMRLASYNSRTCG